ncbi:MAG: hypothetical protein AB7S81_05955 [Bdellovibrionales bacterium]
MDKDDLSGTQYRHWEEMGRPNIDAPNGDMMHQLNHGPYKPISLFSSSPSPSPSYGTGADVYSPGLRVEIDLRPILRKGASILKPFVVNAVKVSTHPVGASLLAYKFFYSSWPC